MTNRTELATEMFNEMNPMQRYEVMQMVPYVKSIVKRHRMVIAYIAANML